MAIGSVLAGGFTFEDKIFKGLSLGAPFVKLICMARAPIAAAMVGKTIGRTIDEHMPCKGKASKAFTCKGN